MVPQRLRCLAVVGSGRSSPDGADVFAFSTNTDVRCPCWTHTDVLRNGLIVFFSAEPRGRPPTIHHADGRPRRNSLKVYLYPSHLLLCDAFDWAATFPTPGIRGGGFQPTTLISHQMLFFPPTPHPLLPSLSSFRQMKRLMRRHYESSVLWQGGRCSRRETDEFRRMGRWKKRMKRKGGKAE